MTRHAMQMTLMALAAVALAAGCRTSSDGAGEQGGQPDPDRTAENVARLEPADAALPPIADAGPRIDASPLRGRFACGEARLVGGDGKAVRSPEVPPDTTTLPENPVLGWAGLASHGKRLYVASGDEVRQVTPQGKRYTMERVAGASQAAPGTSHFRAGVPCGEARFRSLGEIEPMADGSLVVIDHKSNAVLRIVHPDDPAQCLVQYVSGTGDQLRQRPDEGAPPTTVPAGGPLSGAAYPNPGNGDGDFRTARHYQPLFPAVIGNDIYVLETSTDRPRTRLVRKIVIDPATSRARRVTTLASIDDVHSAFGFAAQDEELYVLAVEGANGAEGVIYGIHPDTGRTREVVRAGREAWHGPSSQALLLSGLTDCDGYLCTSAAHQLWRVHPRTGAIEVFAGAGNLEPRGMEFSELPARYDHLAAHPPLKTALPMSTSRGTSRGFLTALEHDREQEVLWLSAETRQSAYLLRLADCATE
jgi:hypothetical protein